MSKITEYFYIFSKLTTSLVLFLIIIVMGYAFFNSYQGIDNNNVNLENKISSLSSDVVLNYNNYEKISKKIDDTDKSIDEIKKILLQKDTIQSLIKDTEEIFQYKGLLENSDIAFLKKSDQWFFFKKGF